MTSNHLTTAPAEGERRAASGYRNQYLVGAGIVLEGLAARDLAWVRVADPTAGRVDDLQVGRTARVDAYQVKWAQYGGAVTLRHFTRGTSDLPSLIAQLADGWRRLRELHPRHRIVVHLVTNEHPSSTSRSMPASDKLPRPYHFAAFIEQAWRPAHEGGTIELDGAWGPVWQALRAAGSLSMEELPHFVMDCSLDFETSRPAESADLLALMNLLFETTAGAERIVELSLEQLLHELGWTQRYKYRNPHEFPTPEFGYRPIRRTTDELVHALASLPGGYLGVFGSPGSGKSTLLTQTLRSLPLRLVRYYAYVPEAQDPSVLRGESVNFLHDVTLWLEDAGFRQSKRPDPSDRTALLELLHAQLQMLGQDYAETQTRTVILIDGLDHIGREQRPERSLLTDLPLPEALPSGVYVVVGSQTDGLPDLPPRVQSALGKQGRRVDMDRLSPQDVYDISERAVPVLDVSDKQQVFQLSEGHPLALIYLLKELQQISDPEGRTQLLETATPYRGNIEEQYEGHWHSIEDDERLVHTLGLLARVRGAIPMRWAAEWIGTDILRRLRRLLLVYFEQEGEDRWVFFHNSFRLFLIDRTCEPLPGRGREELNQAHHRELAAHWSDSPGSWRWEALYHYYSAGDTAAVVRLATQQWFREQVEALRPLDAIQTDVRLAIQAAAECEDVVALARLTLMGASLEQRAWTLEKCRLPDLLIQVGEAVRAVEHLRDGNRLRVEAEQALRLSTRLTDAGLEREGYRLFELAEPLELLSGRAISDRHGQSENPWKVLGEWVESAVVLRGVRDVVPTIRRIRIVPQPWKSGTTVEQASQRLQAWLLQRGALACCRRGDWEGWRAIFDSLDEDTEALDRFSTLLYSARVAHQTGDTARSASLFARLAMTYSAKEIEAVGTTRERFDACLGTAELALALGDNVEIAHEWTDVLPLVPLQLPDAVFEEGFPLHELRFRQARLLYLLSESRSPADFRDEAEAHTKFGQYVNDEEKATWRQTALAIHSLARLCAWGRHGTLLEPTAFLQEVRWILDLFGAGWNKRPRRVRSAIAEGRAEVLRYVIAAAAKHGSGVVHSLKGELESRWADPGEGTLWGAELQRELVTALVDAGADSSWAEVQLERIERSMLHGREPYERVKACEAQAEAWLAIGKREAALRTICQMAKAARGIPGDHDYQLAGWVSWLGRMNEAEPERVEERTRLMLRRIAAVEGTASGVGDAAGQLLEVVFRWSPQRAVRLFKSFLEQQVIGYQRGITQILTAALTTAEIPIREVFHAVIDLVLPLLPGSEPELAETLVAQVFEQEDRNDAMGMARFLVERVRTDVLATHRSAWLRGVADGLVAASVFPEQAGLNASEIQEGAESSSSSSLDYSLHLKTGERLEPKEVLVGTVTPDDLKALLEQEDQGRTQYFKWTPVFKQLVPKLSREQVSELKEIVVSRPSGEEFAEVLTVLSKRALELGERVLAWELGESALKATAPSGWTPYYDGGRRYAALRQLIAVDPARARKTAIHLYGRDLSERFRSTIQIIPYLDELLLILTDRLPVVETWAEIELYLDELFSSVQVEPQPELEESFSLVGIASPDRPGDAITTLVALHLDHPSYVVAQAAVRACTALLLHKRQTIVTALHATLSGSDKAVERMLMVLDAASVRSVAAVRAFTEELEGLRSSPNFAVRLVACRILARIRDEAIEVPSVERALPGIYSLHLPEIALHHTEQAMHGEEGPVFVGDPAQEIRPFDMELRALAGAAGLPEDNVLYRAAQLFRALRTQRTWLGTRGALTPERLSTFLDRAGLSLSHNKPHISPARQALAYVAGELYDGGYLPPDALRLVSTSLLCYDPVFVLERPVQRPSLIHAMGGISYEYSSVRVPDGWVEKAEDSLSLLLMKMPDGRHVIGERTQLRLLEDDWPEEERLSVVRARWAGELWNGLDVEDGHPPFFRVHGVQADDYLHLQAPVDHLVIFNASYVCEAPGATWLALNPAVGRALGWQPIPDTWFSWRNRVGDVVAESVWWSDGPIEQHSVYLHVEVGDGWLVLVTESGFEEIRQWTTHLNRGGVVRRGLGQYHSLGHSQAHTILGTV